MKFDKKNILLVLLVFAAIFALVYNSFIKKDYNVSKISIVENYNEFYTVNSCLYRTITYLNDKDVDSLILILDKKYKSKNKINKNNLLNYLPQVNNSSTFVSRKMYYQKINENVTKYYVYGYIEEETFDGMGAKTDAYFIVNLDSNNKTFSIEPYSKEQFDGGIKNG